MMEGLLDKCTLTGRTLKYASHSYSRISDLNGSKKSQVTTLTIVGVVGEMDWVQVRCINLSRASVKSQT